MNKLYLKKNNGFTPTPILQKESIAGNASIVTKLNSNNKQKYLGIGVSFANAKRGFTLVEALVAISILMVAIAAPMSLAQKGTGATEFSTDQMIATYLAQDAIEAVKNIRDEVALTPYEDGVTKYWLEPFVDKCICNDTEDECNKFTIIDPSDRCNIDTSAANLINDESIKNIRKDKNLALINIKRESSGLFKNYYISQIPGEKSKFSRFINISPTDLDNGAEAIVRVKVCWPLSLDPNSCKNEVYLKDYIYNYSNNENILNQ